MSDFSELKRLAEAATPGPWSMCGEADGSEGFEIIQDIWNERGTHTGKDVVVYEWSDESDPLGVINRKDAEFIAAANPAAVLALIAENDALKGPHDWLAEDLIKELVDNAQAIQENSDDGEEDQFVIVLLAAAQRIRRQEANIEKLKADGELSAKTADCWDRLNILNKALGDSFRAERDQIKAECEGLRESLTHAADEIESWGAYASDYFQQKHDLAGTVLKIRQAAMSKESGQ